MKIRISEDQRTMLDNYFTATGVKASEAINRAIIGTHETPTEPTTGPYDVMFDLVSTVAVKAKLEKLTRPGVKTAEVVRRLIEKLEA